LINCEMRFVKFEKGAFQLTNLKSQLINHKAPDFFSSPRPRPYLVQSKVFRN